jgi:hypothetical protein
VGLAALTTLVGRDLLTWYPAASPALQKYLAQRILYVIVTNTDLPAVEVILAGAALWFAARRRELNTLKSSVAASAGA